MSTAILEKTFCPTGPGGGIDPTCGSGTSLKDDELLSLLPAFSKIPNTKEREDVKRAWTEPGKGYEVGGYDQINGMLRTGKSLPWLTSGLQSQVSLLSKTFDIAEKLPKDAELYRGRRSFGNPPYTVGMVFQDKGFVSTSADKSIADKLFGGSRGALLHIRVPKGTPVVSASGGLKEKEVVLRNGSTFKVTKIAGNHVYMEMIG